MLVLTRKAKEQIQIGPYVTITVLKIKGQSVRLGIEAPKDVCVLRTELAEKMADGGRLDPTITAALFARFRSRRENSYADRLLAALRNAFGGHAIRR